jgi:hypothetical protein
MDLAPHQLGAFGDRFTWSCGNAVFCPRQSLDPALDVRGSAPRRGHLAFPLYALGRHPFPLQKRRFHPGRDQGAIAAIAMMVFATLVMPRIDSANKHRATRNGSAATPPTAAQLWVLEDSY